MTPKNYTTILRTKAGQEFIALVVHGTTDPNGRIWKYSLEGDIQVRNRSDAPWRPLMFNLQRPLQYVIPVENIDGIATF